MQLHSNDYLWMQIVEYVLDKCCDIMVVDCRSNNAKLIFANDYAYWNGWQVTILHWLFIQNTTKVAVREDMYTTMRDLSAKTVVDT